MSTPTKADGSKADAMVHQVSTEHDLPADVAAKRHIRYFEDDLEAQEATSRSVSQARVRRRGSSFSIRSGRGERANDPNAGLPITYRTVSFNIANSQERSTFEAQKKKKAVADVIGERDWHLISAEEIYKRQKVDPAFGLTEADVTAKNEKYGHNVHASPPSRLLQRLFWYFFSGFGSILFGGAILVFISWKPLGHPPQVANLVLALVLVGVWITQALFNLWQDISSSRIMKSITGMLPEDCLVLRNGSKQTVAAADVVPGDILYFKAGNKLPADLRFIQVTGDAKFDRGILTGESVHVAAVTDSTEENYLETKCIGLQGTHCTSGSGTGVIVSIGDQTVFGQIAKMSSQPSNERTYLQKEVIRFVFIITALMVSMSLVIIAIWAGYIRHAHPDYMPPSLLIVDIVSVAIAFIPEGLPFAVTASLTIVANTMKRHDILCKSLKTVETLGCVSVLLSDKTGTLTKNQMVVTDCMLGFTTMTAFDAEKRSGNAPNDQQDALQQIRMIAGVCNAAEFDSQTINRPLSERTIIGDATDQAILRFSETLGSVAQARNSWRKRFDLPFNSKNKFLLQVLSPIDTQATRLAVSTTETTTFDTQKDMLLLIKGAPDILIPRCSKYVGEDGDVHDLDESFQANVNAVKDRWSREGKRVILLARKTISSGEISVAPEDGNYEPEALRQAEHGLLLAGLVAMSDPPRDEIPEVIATLRNAGIRTMMVTGDFKLTAQAIARSCSIITCPDEAVHSVANLPRHPGNTVIVKSTEKNISVTEDSSQAIVISGAELPTLTTHQWELILQYPAIVFARTTPDQKLLIVQRFRAAGFVTAMTGDGVNDAPSLREADIGIAPGSGSDIALEAADMVLLSSFSSIIPALAYGRSVFSNLRKTIAYLLPAGSYSEFWPVMTSVAFGLPQILSSFMMIIICCCTDCVSAIALAYEKPEADLLSQPPRNVKKDRLVDWKLLVQAYLYTGTLESLLSFALSYSYLQHKGITFGMLWFSFGNYTPPPGKDLDYVNTHLLVGSGIYFVTLVVLQWFNLMGVRTRRLSIFQHSPVGNTETQNYLLFPAILFALVIAVIFVYIDGIHSVAGSGSVPVQYWFIPMALGLAMLCLEESRKACVRRWPRGLLARIAW